MSKEFKFSIVQYIERERKREREVEEEEESSGLCVGRYSNGTFTFILQTHSQIVKIETTTEYIL